MCDPSVTVATSCDLPVETILGPLASVTSCLDPLLLIGLRCSDVRPLGQTLKVDPRKLEVSEADSSPWEWLHHIQSARDDHEQNVEVVTHEGRLFYRTIRAIRADEELLVWYSARLATLLGLSDPHAYTYKGDGKFCCPYCSEVFLYPNPCCAHVLLRCEQRRLVPNMPTRPPSESTIHSLFVPEKLTSAGFTVEFLTNNSSDSGAGSNPRPTTGTDVSTKEKPNTTSKRKHEEERSSEHRKRPAPPFVSLFESSDKDHNQNVRKTLPSREGESTGSAFKKVDKTPSVALSQAQATSTENSPPYTSTLPSVEMLYHQTAKPPLYTMSFPVSVVPTSPHISHSPLSAFAPTKLAVDDLVDENGRAAAIRPTLYPDSLYRLPCVGLPGAPYPKTPFGTPLDNFLAAAAAIVKPSGPSSQISSSPVVQPPPPPTAPQPPVAPLLPPSLAALSFPAQNWCAKCNASFRMTSDLVYHMRSHHKREVDPAKKRRDEKLKCSICNESFRERHHLTRHMTSHQ